MLKFYAIINISTKNCNLAILLEFNFNLIKFINIAICEMLISQMLKFTYIKPFKDKNWNKKFITNANLQVSMDHHRNQKFDLPGYKYKCSYSCYCKVNGNFLL